MCAQRPKRSHKRESCEKLISHEISSPSPAAARIALRSNVLPSRVGRTNQNAGTGHEGRPCMALSLIQSDGLAMGARGRVRRLGARPRVLRRSRAADGARTASDLWHQRTRVLGLAAEYWRPRQAGRNQQPRFSGVVLSRLPVPLLHSAAPMADRRPLLAIARALAANGRALAQTSAAARNDPVTLQGDVQDVQREVGAGAVCDLPNAERFTSRRGIWAVAATIATAVRTSPTANLMLAAVAQFRFTSIPGGRAGAELTDWAATVYRPTGRLLKR